MKLNKVLETANLNMPLKAIVRIYSKFIEIAKVENGQINSFSPLSIETLKSLYAVSNLNGKFARISGDVPKELGFISFSQTHITLVWKEPGGKRMLFLEDGQHEVELPPMIFSVSNKSLVVLTYKGRLNDKTVLYHNALPNGTVNVCLGNMKVGSYSTIIEIMDEYRRLYWQSTFEDDFKGIQARLKNNFNQKHKAYGDFKASLRR